MAARQTRRAGLLLAVLATAATGACSVDDQPNPAATSAADVAFATDMAEHHAQTVQLVNLAVTRTLPASQWAWTEAARTRRIAELRILTHELKAWGEPVPETGMQHADEGKHLAFDTDIPGVAAEAEVHALENLRGGALARRWLQLMIRHEKGAAELAQAEAESGQNAHAVAYARDDFQRHRRLATRLEQIVTGMQG